MARLDYEKARRNSRASAPGRARRSSPNRQRALSQYVKQHGLRCFKCAATTAEWAKTGTTNGRPWAICLPCIKRNTGEAPEQA